MLFDWFGRTEKTTSAKKGRQPLRSAPRVEALEDRFMPGAIRTIAGDNAHSLPAEDDDPSALASVGFNLNFFGVQSSQVYVNNNGNITFGQALAQFTPNGLDSNNGGIPIIAPYFADVDTRVGPVVTYGTGTLCGFQAFVVNWVGVGYYSEHVDKTDSFQLVLIDRPDTGAGNFDIEFNYNSMLWETGDASGGTDGLGGDSAVVGYSNGTGDAGSFFQLAGSAVNGALINGGPDALISHELLASTPGRYHFEVRNGTVVEAPKVNDDVTDQTKAFFPFRYTPNLATHIDTGNLTVINSIPAATASGLCLDETNTTNGSTGPLNGPINVVFTSLPSDVRLLNPTGYTASGLPYITANVAELPSGQPVLRVPIQLYNPSNVPTTTFEMGYPVRVYSGNFDPTML
jgi:hypothetical protein